MIILYSTKLLWNPLMRNNLLKLRPKIEVRSVYRNMLQVHFLRIKLNMNRYTIYWIHLQQF